MLSHEGAGRVRLANGRRMSLQSYCETITEQYPVSVPVDESQPEFDELVADVHTLRHDVERLRGSIEPRTALLRAQADLASGKLHSDVSTSLKRHAAEADLWS